jgi:hypothetical protein
MRPIFPLPIFHQEHSTPEHFVSVSVAMKSVQPGCVFETVDGKYTLRKSVGIDPVVNFSYVGQPKPLEQTSPMALAGSERTKYHFPPPLNDWDHWHQTITDVSKNPESGIDA